MVTATAPFFPSSRAQAKASAVRARKGGRPVAALTAYDYPTARLLDEAGIDLILVGDSLGMVILGYPDTTEVTLEDMRRHTGAAARGVKEALLVADLSIGTYDTTAMAVASARTLAEAGADAVKLEGGRAQLPQIVAILAEGIPVVGHLGMLPQKVREEGGYKKKGKTAMEADAILEDALALDAAGVCAIVLESVVPSVAAAVTRATRCPIIGIGAGKETDGQIRVIHDLIGTFPWFRPAFAECYYDGACAIEHAARQFLASLNPSTPEDTP